MTCSDVARELGEPLAATAPVARGWVVIEAPGAWGRNALLDGPLPEGLGVALAAGAEGTGTTVLLARRPGRGGPEAESRAHRVWIAHTAPGGVRMRVLDTENLDVLRDLDFAAIARGESPGTGERSIEPVLFVCANAKRDACCALLGGAVARTLAAGPLGDRVWECSHIGGHRFAATALLLPFGTVHGRLDAESASAVLTGADAGVLDLAHYRGRSALLQWQQAAEIAVRSLEGIDRIEALDVLRATDDRAVPHPVAIEPAAPQVVAEVRCADGRSWRVTVRRVQLPERIESCAGDPVAGWAWVADEAERAPDWLV